MLLITRLIVGILFVYSGLTKLIRPNEYFQIAIAQYDLFPIILIPWISHITPWIEVVFGAHFLLGLYTVPAAAGLAVLAGAFQLLLAQALFRRLPIDECGCFGGGAFTLTLYQSFALDTLIAILVLLHISDKRPTCSLDSHFD